MAGAVILRQWCLCRRKKQTSHSFGWCYCKLGFSVLGEENEDTSLTRLGKTPDDPECELEVVIYTQDVFCFKDTKQETNQQQLGILSPEGVVSKYHFSIKNQNQNQNQGSLMERLIPG